MAGEGEFDLNAELAALYGSVTEERAAIDGLLDAYDALQTQPTTQKEAGGLLLDLIKAEFTRIAVAIGARLSDQTIGLDTASVDTAAAHDSLKIGATGQAAEREPIRHATIINKHTLRIGERYVPVTNTKKAIFDTLRVAPGPLTVPAISRNIHAGPNKSGGYHTLTLMATQAMADELNTSFGREVLKEQLIDNIITFQLDQSPDQGAAFIDAPPRADQRPYTTSELRKNIVDISELDLPTEQTENSTVMTILLPENPQLPRDSIQVNGREERLVGNNLYLFNRLLLKPGYNTVKELRVDFPSERGSAFSDAIRALITHLNGEEGENGDILLCAGYGKSRMYALGSKLVFAVQPEDDAPMIRKRRARQADTLAEAGENEVTGATPEHAYRAFGKLIDNYRNANLAANIVRAVHPTLKQEGAFEAAVAKNAKVNPEDVHALLVMGRLSEELGRPFGPDLSLTMVTTLKEHSKTVYAEVGKSLRGGAYTDRQVALLALHFGLPADLPVLDLLQVQRRTGVLMPYKMMDKWAKQNGRELEDLLKLFLDEVPDLASITQEYNDALATMKQRLDAQSGE